MNVHKIVLLLVIFSLVGCNCNTKKNIVINPQYNTVVEESRLLLQDDFNNKAGSNKVYFVFDSSTLSKDAKDTLRKQAKWLKDNPLVLTSIEGHCDEIGTKAYNLALGLKRASAVSNFLIAQGIDKTRLTVISYGKEKPEFLEHTKRAHQLNRRSVTIIVTSQAL
jgi:peptidoglycan-associated lipoprotein